MGRLTPFMTCFFGPTHFFWVNEFNLPRHMATKFFTVTPVVGSGCVVWAVQTASWLAKIGSPEKSSGFLDVFLQGHPFVMEKLKKYRACIHIHVLIDVHLVGGFNPSEKYMSNTGENKNIWNHHLDIIYMCIHTHIICTQIQKNIHCVHIHHEWRFQPTLLKHLLLNFWIISACSKNTN